MKSVHWDGAKNALLKKTRGITFEEVIQGKVIKVLEHPNKKKYPNQKILAIWHKKYVYLVPFVEDEEKVFLKTIIPSRKATKLYGL